MKCPQCRKDYEDSFEFCPHCGEKKPDVPKDSTGQSESQKPQGEEDVILGQEKKARKKPFLIVSVIVLLLLIGGAISGVLITVIWEKPPSAFGLGNKSAGEATIKNLMLIKEDEGYKLNGSAIAGKDGMLNIHLKITTDKTSETRTINRELVANEVSDINEAIEIKGRAKKGVVSKVEYEVYEFEIKDYPTDTV